MQYVGIDPSRKGFHTWALINSKREFVEWGKVDTNFKIINNINRIHDKKELDPTELLIGIEEGNPYLVEMFLKEGYQHVYTINPFKLKNFTKSFDTSGQKTDWHDALMAAEYTAERHQKLKPSRLLLDIEKEAKEIANALKSIKDSKTQAWQKFWAQVDNITPGLSKIAINFESNWFLASIDLLGKCKTMGAKAYVDFCAKRNCRTKKETLILILGTLKELNKNGNVKLIQLHADAVKLFLEEDKIWTKSAGEVLLRWREGLPLFTIKRFGPKTGIRFLAYVGADWSGVTATKLAAYTGVAPVFKGTGTPDATTKQRLKKKGKRVKKDVRIHRLPCNRELKSAMCLFSLYSKNDHEWAKDAYKKYREKGQSHWEALRNLSIRWLRIMVHIVQNKLVYDPMIHMENQRTKTHNH